MRTWEGRDPDYGRPIAAPLEQCAELLDVDLVTVREVAANVELPSPTEHHRPGMGVVVRACAAAGSRTFALASVPRLHHDTPADAVGQYPGGRTVPPRPSPRPDVTVSVTPSQVGAQCSYPSNASACLPSRGG